MSQTNKLSWSERVNAISVNPDMATRDDVARLAAELMAASKGLMLLNRQNEMTAAQIQALLDGLKWE